MFKLLLVSVGVLVGILSFFVNLKANEIKRLSFLSAIIEIVLFSVNIYEKEYLFALLWASFLLGSLGSIYRNYQLKKEVK